MNEHQAILFLTGILFAQLFSKVLKNIIKQSRPIKSKTYGMPSSRATIISFIVFFLIFTNKFSRKTKLIIIVIGIISLAMKYIIKEHFLSQLLIGVISGMILAYIFSIISKKFDK